MNAEGNVVSAGGAAAPTSQDGRWFVLHTRSRQEKALAADLAAMGVDHFLPLTQTVRYYGRRKLPVLLPLFPGYLFLFGSVEQAFAADRTRRVAHLIQVSDQDRLQRELASLELALDRGAPLDPCPHLREGMWVEVRSGPFKGVQGVVEEKHKADRLLLQVDVLGQGASLEIEGALLEPVDEPRAAAV